MLEEEERGPRLMTQLTADTYFVFFLYAFHSHIPPLVAPKNNGSRGVLAQQWWAGLVGLLE